MALRRDCKSEWDSLLAEEENNNEGEQSDDRVPIIPQYAHKINHHRSVFAASSSTTIMCISTSGANNTNEPLGGDEQNPPASPTSVSIIDEDTALNSLQDSQYPEKPGAFVPAERFHSVRTVVSLKPREKPHPVDFRVGHDDAQVAGPGATAGDIEFANVARYYGPYCPATIYWTFGEPLRNSPTTERTESCGR